MNNFLACPMQYLDILIMKKIFMSFQKSKFNWILYILSGDCIAESIDFFFLNHIMLSYGLFVNWAKDKEYKGMDVSTCHANLQCPRKDFYYINTLKTFKGKDSLKF